MNLAAIKDWIVALSGSVSMLAVALGIWMSLREFRLKLRAEARQQQSADVESDVRLQTLFSELMKTANGRSGYQVSEKAVEFLLQNAKSSSGQVDIPTLNRAIENLAVLRLPVGSAAQDAAVASIAALTLRHKSLEQPGIRALEALCKPVTSRTAEETLKEVQKTLAARAGQRM